MKHLTAVVLALCLMGVCVPKAGRAEDYVTLSQLREQLPATWESRRMGQAEGVLKAPIILPAADKLPAMTMLPRQDVSNETFQDSWGAEAPDFYLNVGQGNIRRVSRKLYLTDKDYATLWYTAGVRSSYGFPKTGAVCHGAGLGDCRDAGLACRSD